MASSIPGAIRRQYKLLSLWLKKYYPYLEYLKPHYWIEEPICYHIWCTISAKYWGDQEIEHNRLTSPVWWEGWAVESFSKNNSQKTCRYLWQPVEQVPSWGAMGIPQHTTLVHWGETIIYHIQGRLLHTNGGNVSEPFFLVPNWCYWLQGGADVIILSPATCRWAPSEGPVRYNKRSFRRPSEIQEEIIMGWSPFQYHWGFRDWVLTYFTQDETRMHRKLSRPCHVPYRITSQTELDVWAVKVYFPHDLAIRIHVWRVKPCLPNFLSGFYWYGGKHHGPAILLSGSYLWWVSIWMETRTGGTSDTTQVCADSDLAWTYLMIFLTLVQTCVMVLTLSLLKVKLKKV